MKLSNSYASGIRHSNASQPTLVSGVNSNSQLNYRQLKLFKVSEHEVQSKIYRKSAYPSNHKGHKMHSSVAHLEKEKP